MTARPRIATLAAVLATALMAAFAGAAHAVSWSSFGAGPSHSGAQPIDAGTTPVSFQWSVGGPGESIRTSATISNGTAPGQRVAYGTTDATSSRAHLRLLSSGGAVGSPSGAVIGDDPDALTGDGGSVSPVEASTSSTPGQAYFLHNDDAAGAGDDISIAQVDQATGTLVRDVPVLGTDGYTVSSSPLLADGPGGSKWLLFVAREDAAPNGRLLFKVGIGNPTSTAATVGTAGGFLPRAVEANPLASPTLVHLGNATGRPTAYAAVGTDTGRIETFALEDIQQAGPRSDAAGGPVQTPTVPVTSTGADPGASGSGLTEAPAVYAAVSTPDGTVVRRYVQPGNGDLVAAGAEAVTGAPSPGLATNYAAGAGDAADDRLMVTTSAGIFSLNAHSLAETGGTPGDFSSTVPAVSGDLAYAASRAGTPVVVRTIDGRQVPAGDFSAGGSLGQSAGQPAISRGFVVYTGQSGARTYRNRDASGPAALFTAPGAPTVSGTVRVVVSASDDRGIAGAELLVDGVRAGYDASAAVRSSFDPEGALYEFMLDTRELDNGPHRVQAVVTDNGGLRTVARTAAGGDVLAIEVANPSCGNGISGTEAADALTGTRAGDTIDALGGSDTVSGLNGEDCLSGGAGDDRLFGGDAIDRLTGGAGNDTLAGELGQDSLSGGAGRDRLSGGEGNDLLSGGAGNDVVSGSDGNDGLEGGAGNDRLSGGDGGDAISGGAGNDVITAGRGRNAINGGAGNDRINAVNRTREKVDCGRGRDTIRADRRDVLRGCERVRRVGR